MNRDDYRAQQVHDKLEEQILLARILREQRQSLFTLVKHEGPPQLGMHLLVYYCSECGLRIERMIYPDEGPVGAWGEPFGLRLLLQEGVYVCPHLTKLTYRLAELPW